MRIKMYTNDEKLACNEACAKPQKSTLIEIAGDTHIALLECRDILVAIRRVFDNGAEDKCVNNDINCLRDEMTANADLAYVLRRMLADLGDDIGVN